MHLKQLCNWFYISSKIGWHTWILKHWGRQGKEDSAFCVFGDSGDKESEDVKDDESEEAGAADGPAWARKEGGEKLVINAPLARFHNWISTNSVLQG